MEQSGNAPEFSVSDLSGAIRRTMEDAFGRVRVRGEISGYRGPHGSGHVYFSLKDVNAKIDAVIWKGVFARLRIRPEEGLEVIATGKVSTFPGSSKYQLIIDDLEPAGLGALLLQLEERKRRLAAEGLFAPERKRPLPYLPDVIGVITSPTGAVIRDILHRLADRFPRSVLLWPVRVQGDGAAGEVIRAIEGFNALTHDDELPRPDVLIVARGGGSLEDLWTFNDEALARAVAASSIPIISAVGHETDTTLIDFVSDHRAPTPTAAAERAVPVRSELIALVEDRGARLTGGLLRLAATKRSDWRSAARALPSPDALLGARRQAVDLAALRLPGALRSNLDRRRRALDLLARRLAPQSPAVRLARMAATLKALADRLPLLLPQKITLRRDRLAEVSRRLPVAFTRTLSLESQAILRRKEQVAALGLRLSAAADRDRRRRAEKLDAVFKLLAALGHHGVLARGYAVIRDAKGETLRSRESAQKEASLEIEFADGRLAVTTGRGPERKAASRPQGGGQGDLF